MTLRLPNGPPVFVGRAQESDALEAAIRRGPVASVWGVGGLGKSSLAFHVLHARFPAQASRTLMVRLARDEAIEEALLTVARTLAELHGTSGVDWRALLADRDALLATVIDLADAPARGRGREAHWIMIDDIHHAEPARAAEIVAQLSRYARKSRWILVGRNKLVPDGALSQAVALGAMPAADLRALAARWASAALVDEQLVAAAAGSPWRLGQLLGGAQPGIEPGAGDLLEGLPAATADFLLDLSLLEVEVPEETLARITTLPPPDVLSGLEQRGWIERRPRGVRLHDVARGLLEAGKEPSSAQAKRRDAARTLCESKNPAAWLEGLRLLVEAGEAAQVAAELDARGAAQLDAGQVFGVWRVLERATAPELASWRLRCATEIGDPPVLRGVPLPPSPSPADRVRWARSLRQQGLHKEAGLAAEEAQASALAEGDASLAFEAGRIVWLAAQYQRLPERALEVLSTLTPATIRQAIRRDIDFATSLVELEKRDKAMAHIRAAEDRLAEHPDAGERELYFTLARVLYVLGALRMAERALARLPVSSGEIVGNDVTSTACLMLSVGVAYDRGAVAKAARLLDKLSPFALRSPVFSVYATLQRYQLRLATGDLDGLKADVLSFVEASAKTLRVGIELGASTLLHQIAIALCDAPEGPPLHLPPNDSANKDTLLLWEAIHRAHWGEGSSLPEAVRSQVPDIQILCRLSGAWVALGTGQFASALSAAQAAAGLAGASGHGLLESYAREAEAVAQLLTCAPAAVVKASAAALSLMARENGMTPLMVQGELLALLATAETFDPARLEEIARSASAPVAARRARALLGDEVALDHIDRAVVSAAQRRLGCRVQRLTAGPSAPEGASGWGLDERTQTVWLPGRAHSFAERPLLWRMLTVIARGGGAVDKDALVVGAWEQRDYHPLRDDARLHTAVRKLRQLIEDDPANPTRLITTEEGYAFGRAAPARWLIAEPG